jgi:anaerobic magnesium-protoporphyrin IX monomethyl ester cyclase
MGDTLVGTPAEQRPVCLIRPPSVETFRFSVGSIAPPLGLAYIGGALEAAGHRVAVVDAVTEAPETYLRYFRGYLLGLPFEGIVDRIPDDAKAVGVNSIFTHEWPAVAELVKAIKRRRPGLPVILGGEHVTSMPEFCLLTSDADYVVLGEGEETVVELVEAIDRGVPAAEILGVGYRDGEAVVVNARRARAMALDDIPLPAWHLFDLDTYHQYKWLGGMYSATKSVPVLATRGCPYQCTYCSAPNMWEPRWIPRDPKLVVDEIEHWVEALGARNFPFQDLTAIVQRQWIIDFCNELLARDLDITWQMPSGTRSEAIDAEVAELLRRTNMISMAYAPESGSETTRKLIKKKMKTDRLFASMQAAVESGLNVAAFFVIGFPHDTEEHIRENLAFMDRIAEIGITDAAVGFYMALPGTQMFDSLYEAGKIRLDRKYFKHILAATSPWATSSYNENFSRLQLTVWKWRLMSRFYSRQRKLAGGRGSSGLMGTVRQALEAIRGGDHADSSKMQTAFRNGVRYGITTVRVKVQRGWMARRRERRYFDGWDQVYRDIRARNLACGATVKQPEDTNLLHEHNVTKELKAAHATRRRIPVTVSSA